MLASHVPGVPLVPYTGTESLLRRLHEIEESPWGDWYGHPLNPRELARLLKPYGVKSTKVRIGELSVPGYRVEDPWEAWSVYVPRRSATSATPLASHVAEVAEIPAVCTACGDSLDHALINAGLTDHGEQL